MVLLVVLIPAVLYGWARESVSTFGCSNDQKPERLSEMHEWDSLQRMNGVGARRLAPALSFSTA